MAEAIATRMVELGLSPGMFATAANVTPAGLAPVRKGYRRQYQTKLKVGVARALRWENDAVDRLLAGEHPVPLTEVAQQAGENYSRQAFTAMLDLDLAVHRFAAGDYYYPPAEVEAARTAWMDAVTEYNDHVLALIEADVLERARPDEFAVAADGGEDPELVDTEGPAGRPSPEPNE